MVGKTFELVGDRATFAALEELGRTAGGAALDASLRRGANVIRKEAAARWRSNKNINKTAAKTPGNVEVRKVKGRPRNSPRFMIGLTGPARYVAPWVEWGTQPHSVKPGASIRKRIFIGHDPMHPGNPPAPFMRPAFDATYQKAIEVFGKDIGRQIERQAARIRRKHISRI